MSHRWQDPFRGLERRLKNLTIQALRRLMRPAAAQAWPDWSARPHRVLYLRYDRIGDMVLATGIISAIRRAQPTITVDVLASVGNAAVLRGNPDVGTVHRIDKARVWTFLTTLVRVRFIKYDAVVDGIVMAPSLTSMLLMWASGARHRIGLADRGNVFALTLPVDRLPGAIHYVEHAASLLAAFAGPRQRSGAPGSWTPRLYLSPEELSTAESLWRFAAGRTPQPRAPTRRLVVNVSAGVPWRHWPEERFTFTIRWLRTHFPQLLVLLVGAPEDGRRARRIAASAGGPVTCTPRLRQMMALVATCDFAFTPDTSVTHIASAFGKPVVAMFARGGGALYGPYGTASQIAVTAARTLQSLEIAPVLRALQTLLSEEAPPLRRSSSAGA